MCDLHHIGGRRRGSSFAVSGTNQTRKAETIAVGAEEREMKADQVGALCVRHRDNGACQVLLITSRDTGRWIIPKGWRAKRMKDHEAAAREAAEEAGVSGKVKSKPIGNYSYAKTGDSGTRSVRVAVFLLLVRRESNRWPEQRERRRAWFDVRKAVEEVGERQLRKLIKGVERLSAAAL
jgi:8-oxo-dGTP pyrophosphatase MutT (NUDIX family)